MRSPRVNMDSESRPPLNAKEIDELGDRIAKLSPAKLALLVEQLAKLPSDKVPLTPLSSLIPIQTNGSKCPFFMIDGHTSYAALSRYFDPDQPLYAFIHESYTTGQPTRYTSVEEIAAYYLSQIHTVQSQGPYFLAGYSFGGMIAFEMAQQLNDQGQKVAL